MKDYILYVNDNGEVFVKVYWPEATIEKIEVLPKAIEGEELEDSIGRARSCGLSYCSGTRKRNDY